MAAGLRTIHPAQLEIRLPHDCDPDSPTRRPLFGIIWTCLSTIIICAWTAVHPNVPPPNQWKARWNRLRLMFWMIIAPELVLAWAVRQFFAARAIRNEYNNRHPDFPNWKKWTLRHGHLLAMGGFSLVDRDQKEVEPSKQNEIVLTFDYFKEHPEIDSAIREITAAEIVDRSKGDALTKVIAILQTTWFIIQCITRHIQRLSLTELELVTLALASLNAVTFVIWWHKPLGVQDPVRIYLEVAAPTDEPAPRQRNFDLSCHDVISKGWKRIKEEASSLLNFLQHPLDPFAFLLILLGTPVDLAYIITFPFFILFPLGIIFLLRIVKSEPVPPDIPSRSRGLIATGIVASLQRFRYWLTSTVSQFVVDRLAEVFAQDYDQTGTNFFIGFFFGWYILLPFLFLFFSVFIITLTPFFTLLFLVSFIFKAVFDIVTTTSIHPGASHVPSFYAPNTPSDRWSRMAVFSLFGVIFGGLHCIGWNFEFPTDLERTIWRSTSLAIAAIPLIAASIDFLLASRLSSRDLKSCETLEKFALLSVDLVMTILLFIYVPARLSLIAQALALLRTQPLGALIAVDWTGYLPNLFLY